MWTLPSLWTHRTRPQGTWKTANHAVFHSAHIDPSCFVEKEGEERPIDEALYWELATHGTRVAGLFCYL
jgi:hypothetical protein